MAVQIIGNNGQVITLENPAERASRYAKELKAGKDSKGNKLTPAQAALRMGVLKERQTQARIFNKKHGKTNKPKKKNNKKVGN